MKSRLEKALVFISAALATAFVSLWLPAANMPLRAGVSLFVFSVLATPVFQWRKYWLLPLGALVAAAVAAIPTSGRIQLVVPVLILVGLLAQTLWRISHSKA